MDRLICSPEMRLGRHSVHEIMSHPFFHGVDWANIRRMESPFVPNLNSITDTSYFPTEDLDRVPDYPEQHGTYPLGFFCSSSCSFFLFLFLFLCI